MLDNEFSIGRNSKAFILSIVSPNVPQHSTEPETLRSVKELRELLRTLDLPCFGEFIQSRNELEPGTILGKGKLEEISNLAKSEGIDLLVFDCDLSASQIRNIRNITGLSIIDRCHVILEIFAQNARTREAKIQIEIARLKYILPRLAGFWSHLSRQRGGIGVRGGEGEQQIELDRRIIKERIEFFKDQLLEVQASRKEQRKKRKNQAVIAALVGYTNAGKSSLMNRLCRTNVREENKLFATLDATYRTLNPDSKPNMILIDTVGFISNLPNTLIEGFKTTLESSLEADLLLIVVDISDPAHNLHLQVTHDVLKELGADKKDRFYIFTKKDAIQDQLKAKLVMRKYHPCFLVSTFDDRDMSNLREKIVQYFLKQQPIYDLFLPYEEGAAHSKVAGKTNVIASVPHEKGVFYRIRIPKALFDSLGLHSFILAPEDPFLDEFLAKLD